MSTTATRLCATRTTLGGHNTELEVIRENETTVTVKVEFNGKTFTKILKKDATQFTQASEVRANREWMQILANPVYRTPRAEPGFNRFG